MKHASVDGPQDVQVPHAVRLPAPEWWREHSLRTLEETYQPYQTRVLEDFRLARPVPVAGQEELIKKYARKQKRDGAAVLFEYGLVDDCGGDHSRQKSTLVVFSGRAGVEDLDSEDVPPENRPLYRLSKRSERVQYETGCTPVEAVDYLLSGVPFVFPWVTSSVRLGTGVIDLRVGSPIVPLEEVRKAYSRALTFLREEHPDALELAPKRRRQRPSRTPGLVAFVEERRRENKTPEDWESLRDEWHAAHPELRPFPSSAAMREAFRRAKKKA